MLILEYVLKMILAMLSLGFLGCFVLFGYAGITELRAKPSDRTSTTVFLLVTVLSILIVILFIWLITIGWWA